MVLAPAGAGWMDHVSDEGEWIGVGEAALVPVLEVSAQGWVEQLKERPGAVSR